MEDSAIFVEAMTFLQFFGILWKIFSCDERGNPEYRGYDIIDFEPES